MMLNLKTNKLKISQNVGTVCTAERRELTGVASLMVCILKSLGIGFKQMIPVIYMGTGGGSKQTQPMGEGWKGLKSVAPEGLII